MTRQKMMRRKTFGIVLLCAAALLFQACENDKNTVKTPVPPAPPPS